MHYVVVSPRTNRRNTRKERKNYTNTSEEKITRDKNVPILLFYHGTTSYTFYDISTYSTTPSANEEK